jgi:hypothetical protein
LLTCCTPLLSLQGVLDSRGRPLDNSKTAFDPTVMKNATQIFYENSGLDGFLAFLEDDMAR